MKVIENIVLKENAKEFWYDSNRTIIDKKVLRKYIKDDIEIELVEDFGFFEDKKDNIIGYKTVIKLFNKGELIKRRLFWTGPGKWNGYSNEMLIDEVFKLIG